MSAPVNFKTSRLNTPITRTLIDGLWGRIDNVEMPAQKPAEVKRAAGILLNRLSLGYQEPPGGRVPRINIGDLRDYLYGQRPRLDQINTPTDLLLAIFNTDGESSRLAVDLRESSKPFDLVISKIKSLTARLGLAQLLKLNKVRNTFSGLYGDLIDEACSNQKLMTFNRFRRIIRSLISRGEIKEEMPSDQDLKLIMEDLGIKITAASPRFSSISLACSADDKKIWRDKFEENWENISQLTGVYRVANEDGTLYFFDKFIAPCKWKREANQELIKLIGGGRITTIKSANELKKYGLCSVCNLQERLSTRRSGKIR